MKISQIAVKNFRRFADLRVRAIPDTARLVVLVGPNGCGKSALIDAILLLYRAKTAIGYANDEPYYNRGRADNVFWNRVELNFHGGQTLKPGSIYARSAHRHDPDFTIRSLSQQGSDLQGFSLKRMIDPDATVASNYQRVASKAVEDLFVNEAPDTSMGEYRKRMIGRVQEPLSRLFPNLIFSDVGNPLAGGTFRFDKNATSGFEYKNLSSGEKAAFDLILDFVIKRETYSDAVFFIDEPELHINSRVQSVLLEELIGLLPQQSQLWIASHSIGMMRKARELYFQRPGSVVFLDFDTHDFDNPVVIEPTAPNRAFWAKLLHVAPDDLASLVTPRKVIICEGNPIGAVPGKNSEHDARVYGQVFSEDYPDVMFISGGSSHQVSGDFLGLAAAMPKIASGVAVQRLIDLDDHSPTAVGDLKGRGVTVLSRRQIESYLWDDEVLRSLCDSLGKSEKIDAVLCAKRKAVDESVERGNPPDDLKKAVDKIYIDIKRILNMQQRGNDANSFARDTLAPLLKKGMSVYTDLERDLFS